LYQSFILSLEYALPVFLQQQADLQFSPQTSDTTNVSICPLLKLER
jgi:hypothetical protein